MRSEYERRQLVRDIVASSNPAHAAVEALGEARSHERVRLMGALFEVDPLPEDAIDGVFRAGLDLMDENDQEGDWIAKIAQSNDQACVSKDRGNECDPVIDALLDCGAQWHGILQSWPANSLARKRVEAHVRVRRERLDQLAQQARVEPSARPHKTKRKL